MPTRETPVESATSAKGASLRAGLSLRGLLQALVGIIALAFVIVKSDMRGLVEIIKSARIIYLPLAVIASFAVTWLMSCRWGSILNVRRPRLTTSRLFRYYLIGIFFTNFVPGGGVSGDLARLIYVDRDLGDKPFVLSTLVYERLVGLFAILLTGLIAIFAGHARIEANRVIIIGEIVLGLAFVATAALMSDYVSSRLARACRWAGARFNAPRVSDAAARTIEAISDLKKHRRMLAVTVALSILIRIVWCLGCYLVALALNLPVGLALIFAFISLVDLIRMLPISVGGLGVREWLLIVLFAEVGIDREQALAFSLLAFAPIYLNAIAGGIIYISMAKLKREETRRADLGLKRSEI